jgi:ClpP class serine protease
MQGQTGVKLRLVSTGQYKGLGADGAVTDDMVAETQRELDAVHALFVAAVARGRGMGGEGAAALADGRTHTGQAAVDAGLADGVMPIEGVLESLNAFISAGQV